jgi:hypothetical protein
MAGAPLRFGEQGHKQRPARLTRCFWPAGRPGTMIGLVIVLLFLGLDLALVVLALLWLSERRSMADITDMRYRGRWRRQ